MPTPSSSHAPAGAAGGDLTGTYPNPTVAAGGVALADLAGYPADATKFARGDNTWAGVVAQTSGTGAGLPGSPSTGAPGRIKVNASPFDFITLYYDSVLAKWVSAPFLILTKLDVTASNASGVGYVNTTNQIGPAFLFGAFVGAGLALQLRHCVNLACSNANNALVALLPQGGNVDAVWGTIVAAEVLELSTSGTSQVVKDSGWTDVTYTSSPTWARVLHRIRVSNTSTTASLYTLGVYGRWVFTP